MSEGSTNDGQRIEAVGGGDTDAHSGARSDAGELDPNQPTPHQTGWAADDVISYDYHRTVIGYHGTRRSTAEILVRGAGFTHSENGTDWLGHGVYFWEYGPKMAWDWAVDRYGENNAAVVGAMVRLGRCLDFVDPENGTILERGYEELADILGDDNLPSNANSDKHLDCAVLNYIYESLEEGENSADSARAIFVPSAPMSRFWTRSGLFRGSHVQLCVRNDSNILAVWHVNQDGSYGLGGQP